MRPRARCLLIRADFAFGNRPGGSRLSCKRWRRPLADALPRLMGCARRCPRAVVRLHDGEGEASYTAWLRIPIERRPSRKRLRKFEADLRARLEAGLLPIDGRVIDVGVRRLAARPCGVAETLAATNPEVTGQVEPIPTETAATADALPQADAPLFLPPRQDEVEIRDEHSLSDRAA